jgi:hypothetical protein
MDDANSGMVFLVAGNTGRSAKLLERMSDYAAVGANTLFVYITDDACSMLEIDAFEVTLEDDEAWAEPAEQLVPDKSRVSVALEYVRYCVANAADACEKALIAAACFIGSISGQEVMREYIELCAWLVDQNEIAQDSRGVEKRFLKCLYSARETGIISKGVLLPDIENFSEVKDICIFGDKYGKLFVSEKLFTQIIKPLLNEWSAPAIKRALSDQGFLEHDRSVFTKKMSYVTPYGKTERVRMLSFNGSRLNLPGEMRFVDLLGLEGDECYED